MLDYLYYHTPTLLVPHPLDSCAQTARDRLEHFRFYTDFIHVDLIKDRPNSAPHTQAGRDEWDPYRAPDSGGTVRGRMTDYFQLLLFICLQ